MVSFIGLLCKRNRKLYRSYYPKPPHSRIIGFDLQTQMSHTSRKQMSHVTLIRMSHVTHIRMSHVTHLIHTYEASRIRLNITIVIPYLQVTWLNHVWRDSFFDRICSTNTIRFTVVTYSHVTWLIHMWCDSFLTGFVPRTQFTRDMTHSYVTWLLSW